jgi:hypothetical protein
VGDAFVEREVDRVELVLDAILELLGAEFWREKQLEMKRFKRNRSSPFLSPSMFT